MPENIRSKTRLFADDTIVYLTITSDIDSVSLQDDLNKWAKWEERWKMSFHPEKYNILTISRKKQPIRPKTKLHVFPLTLPTLIFCAYPKGFFLPFLNKHY
jgi:hypothetical protein